MSEVVPSFSPPGSSQSLFVDSWQVYRKMVDNDYLFHRGAYGTLGRILRERHCHPYAILDVACGDASMTAEAISGTPVAAYYGFDLSEQALRLAKTHVSKLACSCDLLCSDFPTALQTWDKPVDVVWIGLSLHHLLRPEKLEAMTAIRRILKESGLFLIYEDASPDGEDRDGWLRRWDQQKPVWTAYSEAEWDYVTAHVHGSDFPETDQSWRDLGKEAGFRRIGEHYRSPTDLFRLYSFEV